MCLRFYGFCLIFTCRCLIIDCFLLKAFVLTDFPLFFKKITFNFIFGRRFNVIFKKGLKAFNSLGPWAFQSTIKCFERGTAHSIHA